MAKNLEVPGTLSKVFIRVRVSIFSLHRSQRDGLADLLRELAEAPGRLFTHHVGNHHSTDSSKN